MGPGLGTRSVGGQVVGQCRPSPHGMHAVAGQGAICARTHIASSEDLGVAGRSLASVHDNEPLCIQRQSTVCESKWGLRSGGKHGHVAGQTCAAAQLHRVGLDASGGVLEHCHAALLQGRRHALLHTCWVIAARRIRPGDQRHGRVGQAVAQRPLQ